jgi:hypothetical protein
MSLQCSTLALLGPQTAIRKSKVLHSCRPAAISPSVPKTFIDSCRSTARTGNAIKRGCDKAYLYHTHDLHHTYEINSLPLTSRCIDRSLQCGTFSSLTSRCIDRYLQCGTFSKCIDRYLQCDTFTSFDF